MDKLQKLELMDKVVRELEDLKNSQLSILKKLSQIEADNITLNVSLLEKKLPDLHEEIDSSVEIVNTLLEELWPSFSTNRLTCIGFTIQKVLC
jgi:mRNA-degrading endonuclease RelE of RelBE toxin-antitoxin system